MLSPKTWIRRLIECIQAHRKALLDIMTSFIPTEKVRFSKRLTRIQHQADQAGVELTFDDGEVIRASVLIGADGIQSTTRAYVLGSSRPEQVRPVYADAYCYRAVIPTAEADEILGDLTHVAKNYFGDRRCAVTYRISGGEVRGTLQLVSCRTVRVCH